MSEVSEGRKLLISLVLDMSEELVQETMEYIMRRDIGYDEDEPPLTEDEIEGLELARQDIEAGRVIPFDEVLKELW